MAEYVGSAECDSAMDDFDRRLSRLERQVNGNGQPGIIQKMDSILIWQERHDAVRVERESVETQHHRSNTTRLNVLMLLATCLLVVASYLALRGH